MQTTAARIIRIYLLALMACLLAPGSAMAEPADIDAASRGVVRIVIIEEQGGELFPVAHGTGFAITPERIVTNAHVVAEAQANKDLSIGIVPSDGGKAVYGRLIAYSARNDLALLATTSAMNLPPLTVAGSVDPESGGVTAVGYPMNVDRAQGLSIKDIFTAQPPVKSRGFLSGRRPSREFDTLLHTAPIGQGSSGGPLLDNCGRVVGVNSFGAESGGADSEFYFAVSTRELLPFLLANDISARVNSLPCRSIAELDAQERALAERERVAAMQQQEIDRARNAQRAQEARTTAQFEIIAERENGMMLSLLLVIAAMAAALAAYELRRQDDQKRTRIAIAVVGVAMVIALVSWILRPGFGDIEDRVAEKLAEQDEASQKPTGVISPGPSKSAPAKVELVCVINIERSRITSGATEDTSLIWEAGGCVNERAQYGLMNGKWSRIFVPQDEAAVSVNSYDPEKREYRVERYLLGYDAMQAARQTRSEFEAPQCGSGETAAREFGNNQAVIAATLPPRPNERLIYDCSPAVPES